MFDALCVLCGNLAALLVFFAFPLRTRLALDRVERRPALCFIAGVLGWIAIAPVAAVLLCTILLAPLVVVELLAVAVGAFIGTAGLALLVGRRMHAVLDPRGTTTETLALVLGIALLTAAEFVPLLGYVVLLGAGIVSLGSTILTFLPDRTPNAQAIAPTELA